jgi:Haem-degrading
MASLGSSRRQRVIVTAIMLPLLVDEIAASVWLFGRNIDHGRTAFVTANIPALQGGAPIRVDNQVVGAVGVAGLSKETDTQISGAAAQVLRPSQNSSGRQ